MDDSISRQEVIGVLNKHSVMFEFHLPHEFYEVKEEIRELPTTQPEQKQGEWKRSLGDLESGSIRCSCCDTEFDYYLVNQLAMESCETEFPKFCPNCGAEMSNLK